MAPPGDSKTFFKAEGGRGQTNPKDLEELVRKANKTSGDRTGVNGILLGPPGAGKGTQVNYLNMSMLGLLKSLSCWSWSMLRKSVYESGLSDHRYGIWALPLLLTIRTPPPPASVVKLWVPSLNKRSECQPVPFLRKRKTNEISSKDLGYWCSYPSRNDFWRTPLPRISLSFSVAAIRWRWKHCPVEEYFSQRHLGGKGHP